jgi:hypothetical protein
LPAAVDPVAAVVPPRAGGARHRHRAAVGGETGRRAGLADKTALTALDYLAATGVVSRLKCTNITLHVLDHLHVAREAVLELAHLPDKLLARLAAAVAD